MQVLRVERRCRLLEMTTTAWICIDIDARVDLYVFSRKVGINELKYGIYCVWASWLMTE